MTSSTYCALLKKPSTCCSDKGYSTTSAVYGRLSCQPARNPRQPSKALSQQVRGNLGKRTVQFVGMLHDWVGDELFLGWGWCVLQIRVERQQALSWWECYFARNCFPPIHRIQQLALIGRNQQMMSHPIWTFKTF